MQNITLYLIIRKYHDIKKLRFFGNKILSYRFFYFFITVDLPPPRQQLYVEYPDPHAVLVDLGCEINPDYVQTEELVGEGECRMKKNQKL